MKSTLEWSLTLLRRLNARRRIFGRMHPRSIEQSLDLDSWDRDHGWLRDLKASDDVTVWDSAQRRWVVSDEAA